VESLNSYKVLDDNKIKLNRIWCRLDMRGKLILNIFKHGCPFINVGAISICSKFKIQVVDLNPNQYTNATSKNYGVRIILQYIAII